MKIRSPICTAVGHVDHGKTSILDRIRETSIVKTEAGAITQHISYTNIPINVIKKICGNLLETLKIKVTIPGLLVIDTPGHAAFTNLRKRGGNLADIAMLVIDINEGVKPQTIEVIGILKQYKTPFVIVANKIDLISGWRSNKNLNLLVNIKQQAEQVRNMLDKKIYGLVGKLSELNFNTERFDRVEDYTKQLAIIPVSAKTGEGIPELLMVLVGLAQKFLENELKIEVKGEAKGTILEVKEEKGLGKILDIIIYDGNIKLNDTIIIGALDKPIETKVKALFLQQDLKGNKFTSVKEVSAAAGLKVSALNIDEVIAGMPLRVANINLDKVKKEIKEEIEEVLIEVDKEGIVIKADSLGSLEALTNLLKEKDIKIKRASIGNISKKDIAEANAENNSLNKVILGFNIKVESGIDKRDINLICHDVIYKIIEDFEKWRLNAEKEIEKEELENVLMPCKIKILNNATFHKSNPAIVGVEVLAGNLKTNTHLMKEDGNKASEVKEIQSEKKNISLVEQGKQVAVSLPNLTVGRQINEGDILYSNIAEEDFRRLKKLKKYLNKDEIQVLKEIALIKRKTNNIWGL